ncbi:unnamed protein product [Heterobilharzia americana]|nr:unnamed protein product [Heterobilharzia americana]
MMRYYANQLVNSMVGVGTAFEALVNLNDAQGQQAHESVNNSNNPVKADKELTTGSALHNSELNESEYREKLANALTNFEAKQTELDQLLSIWPNHRLINPTLLSILQRLTGDSATSDMNFAWRVLQMDYSTLNPFGIVYGHDAISNPAPVAITKQKSKAPSSRGEKTVQSVKANTAEEAFTNRWAKPVDPNILVSIVRIQSVFRRYRIRQAKRLNQVKFIADFLSSIKMNSYASDKLKQSTDKSLLQKIKRLSSGWITCLNVLQQGHYQSEVGVELIQKLVLSNSLIKTNDSSVQQRLVADLNLYLSAKEYTGTYSEIPSAYPMDNTGPSMNTEKFNDQFHKDWIHLLFRDCIYPPTRMDGELEMTEEVNYSIQMKTLIPDSYILLINNDNGVTIRPSVEFPYTWLPLPENKMGYSLLGIANNGPASSGKWSLRVLGPGVMGSERLPKPLGSASQSLCSNFHTIELEDYYEPNSRGLVFRRQVVASNDSLITAHLRLSVPNVFTRLCLKMGDKEVAYAEGYGGACIFAYMLLADALSSNSGRKSQGSNSGRLVEAAKTDVIKSSPRDVINPKLTTVKSSTARMSPRKSAMSKRNVKPGSGSSSSTGGSTLGSSSGSSGINSANPERRGRPVSSGLNSPHISDEKENNVKEQDRHYWIEAYVDSKQWPLSISNWSFLEERRCAKLEECQVNHPSRGASADKSSSGRTVKSATIKSAGGKSSGVAQKSGSGRGTSAKIDINQAHWRMRLICNNAVSCFMLDFIELFIFSQYKIRGASYQAC